MDNFTDLPFRYKFLFCLVFPFAMVGMIIGIPLVGLWIGIEFIKDLIESEYYDNS